MSEGNKVDLGRRAFLKAVGGAVAVAGLPDTALAAPSLSLEPVLWCARGNDAFRLNLGQPQGMATLNWLLRDVHTGQAGMLSREVARLLCWMQAWLAGYGVHARFDLLSGLRMPGTNAHTEGAALRSRHLPDRSGRFHAVDFRPRGVSAEYLARLAWYAGQGGVGIYVREFVHVDDGRRRSWRHY